MSSIGYYDQHAVEFFDRTMHLDMNHVYQKFLPYVPHQGRILDAGCGVGRDSRFFLDAGYAVVAFDGSIEMVKLASKFLQQQALHLSFNAMCFFNEFDAVFAQASLLHVSYEELRDVIESFHAALRQTGILYVTFKYGVSMRQMDDRVFYDQNEKSIETYFQGLFTLLEVWKSVDVNKTASQSK